MLSARTNGRTRNVILCGVDHSRVALEALRTAASLGSSAGLGLVAAHVVAPAPVRVRPWTSPEPAARDRDLAAGEALLDQVCAVADLPDVDRRVLVGRPAERLAELADELAAELIVVGSRGHRLLQATFVGSVSSELLGLSPCPVLVVPAMALDWEEAG
jgi:nucleotide-binding universal stress UspA family protein